MMDPPTPPPKSPPPAGKPLGANRSPSTPATATTSGYRRSPSVTAAIDFFESKSSTSISDIASRSNSPRPSISSIRSSGPISPPSTPGPSSARGSTSSPRPRPTPGRVAQSRSPAANRTAASPASRGEQSRSPRTSIDSTASGGATSSGGRRTPVGLGMRGVGSIAAGRELRRPSEGSPSVGGARRVSDTAAITSPPRKLPGPRPSLPTSNLSSPGIRQGPGPGTARRNSDKVSPPGPSSPGAGPIRTTPRNTPSSKLQPSPNVPSPRETSPRTLSSPRATSSPRMPLTSSPRTPASTRATTNITTSPRFPSTPSPRTPSSSAHRPSRKLQVPRTTPAPGIKISQSTPDRSNPSARSGRPPDPQTPPKNTSPLPTPSDEMHRETQPFPISVSMVLSNSGASTRSSTGSLRVPDDGNGDVVILDSDEEETNSRSPRRSSFNRPPIQIPRRTSSAASSMEPSPTNSVFNFSTGPTISPRKSSKSSLISMEQQNDLHDPISRRASRSVMLGDVYETNENGTEDKHPTNSSPIIPTISSTAASPRPDRKSPGLKIETPTLPFTRTISAKPSPPIPAKSPLRSISRQSSGSHMTPLSATSSAKDSDSIKAVAGTPVTPAVPSASGPPARPDRRASTATIGGDPDQPSIVEPTSDTSRLAPKMLGDEIRFTTKTAPSVYSQDSAPTSATDWEKSQQASSSPALIEEGIEQDGVKAGRRRSRMDDLWGKMREAKASEDGHELDNTPLKVILPDGRQYITTDSPVTASTLNTAISGVASDVSNQALMGHSPLPLSPVNGDASTHRPVRSPSAPVLKGLGSLNAPNKAVRLLGINQPPTRSETEPTPLLPSAMTRSPTAPILTPRTASSSSTMSKRSHLIREIAATERAYATDLALIRDAYLNQYLRPASTSSGDTTFPGSRRGSTTPQSDKRLSGIDWTSVNGYGPGTLARSPSEINSSPYGYFTSMTASASTTSTFANSVSSFSANSGVGTKAPTTPNNTNGMMGPPIGKPLAPNDMKAVFLNIDQLAAGAEELASAFEQAIGDDDQISAGREGEYGNDCLGEVFTTLIPRLRPVYHYYCSRQHTASQRLQELLLEPAHANYLHECWSRIKTQTHAWNLDSMLIKPVQRITKYPLLFEDLLGCTTPVHPDYFHIRSAAELARSIAMEIDEAKRRKDVVASALNKKLPGPSPVKQAGKGLKLFRKDKDKSTISLPISTSTASMSTISISGDTVPEISRGSFITLKVLVERVEEAESVVRRVGKEIVLWTAGAKEILISEDGLIETWTRVIRLDEGDAPADRLLAFREVLKKVIGEVWGNLNEEVKESIMPIFAKLLDAAVNPRKVINKRESKHADYTRYLQLVKSKKNIDKTLLASSRDFCALHTQLVDELPAFLEGYSRILDLALVSFASAQSRYHLGVKTALEEFSQRWIARPRRSPKLRTDGRSPQDNDYDESADLSSGLGIVKAWHDAWTPYADAMEHFQCTKPARAVASRLASFNTRPGSRPSSRPSSPGPQTLHHSSSFTTNRSHSSQSLSQSKETTNRTRSTSLLGPAPQIISPTKESSSRFGVGLLRGGSKTPKSYHSAPRTSRPSSLHIPQPSETNTNRYSFGLPRIPNDTKVFEGLGLSPTKSMTVPSAGSSRATSDPTRYDPDSPVMRGKVGFPSDEPRVEGLGLGEIQRKSSLVANTSPERRGSPERRVRKPEMVTRSSYSAPNSRVPSGTTNGKVDYSVDASEGWRNEPVLYQCACVADFDPLSVGNRKYRGLKFLPMLPGDLFDIFHEVGRIDELPSFPYPEIGVDNDGVLVGRGERGDIGLLICSFLEPLRA